MAVKKAEDILLKLQGYLSVAIDELGVKGIHIQAIHVGSERDYNPYGEASLSPRTDRYKRKITINLTTDLPNYIKGG